jgi:hypothetical protein
MDDSELFDVFNVDNNPEPAQKTIQAPPREKPKKQKKSKHENTVTNDKVANGGGGGGGVNGKRRHDHVSTETSKKQQMDGVESTGIARKMRKLADNPIIVDSFETETDQIVPATTGLQGVAPTDQNIVIKKRVESHNVFALTGCSIDMQPYFQPQIGSLLPLNHINLRIRLHESTPSN